MAFFVLVVCVARVCVSFLVLRLALSLSWWYVFGSFSCGVVKNKGKRKRPQKSALNGFLCFSLVRCVGSSEKTEEKRQAVKPAAVLFFILLEFLRVFCI